MMFISFAEILRRSFGSTTESEATNRTDLVRSLVEMGFTERQAQLGLKRTKLNDEENESNVENSLLLRFSNDLQAATDLLINQQDWADDEEEDEDASIANPNAPVRLFDRHGPFVSVRKFREANFQLNPKVNRWVGRLRRDSFPSFRRCVC